MCLHACIYVLQACLTIDSKSLYAQLSRLAHCLCSSPHVCVQCLIIATHGVIGMPLIPCTCLVGVLCSASHLCKLCTVILFYKLIV